MTFANVGPQSGAFYAASTAPGGGLALTTQPSQSDTLWIATQVGSVAATARVTASLEVRRVGPGGMGIAIGDQGDEEATPLLVTVLPGGSVAVRDRGGRTVIAPAAVPGFTGAGAITLAVELRGSAVTLAANGQVVGYGIAEMLVNGPVSVLATGDGDVVVRRIAVERLLSVPWPLVCLRTSRGVPIPVLRPSRFFTSVADGRRVVAIDTLANTVTLTGSQETDLLSLAAALGTLPAAVRIEADVSMPHTCEQPYAGLVFGRRDDDNWAALLFARRPDGTHWARLIELGGPTEGTHGGAAFYSRPFATPDEHKHFAVVVRGTSVTWTVDDHTETVTMGAEPAGQFGLAAGPGCTVRYENLRISTAL